MVKKGLLERLRGGEVIIGDGGFVIALEKRGYVKAGPFTPEATVENPHAVRELHREFLRAGSDVMQTFTFFSTDARLAIEKDGTTKHYTCREINEAGCSLAREVANEGNALVAGSISTCPVYSQGKGKQEVQAQVRQQLDVMVKHKVDFILAEFFRHCEELEWVIEEAKKTGLTIAATLTIGIEGDNNGVPPGECAVRAAKAGAQVVGLNCQFDPTGTLKTMKIMKEALHAAGLSPFLMTQPNGFHCPGTGKHGYTECPEYPLAMEPRQLTRFDAHKYARAAYDLGVRYIGGCCGFEAQHIRGIAEELVAERGGVYPKGSEKHEMWGQGNVYSSVAHVRERVGRDYWMNIVPSSGRLDPPTAATPRKTQ
ncbi:hypothetical protein Pmani_037450 [Petrolisthes manimaculis]|uniref:Hcy-binding domain-containing protein n=1 Tax=Petrolisthes manimaculis TaxID=1843537 RepID=A0AAE1NG86_9EUCA|nr:hypothetical protein Pmani_037450 [Petrolisthes manimaculis]